MGEDTSLPIEPVTKTAVAIKVGIDQVRKMAVGLLTIIAEVAIVGFIGATIGVYMSAKTIVADCGSVEIAKVGDHYVKCTVVEPKKDAVNQPPR